MAESKLDFVSGRSLLDRLSGDWEGSSTSLINNVSTYWKEVSLDFVAGTDGLSGTISGRGVSLWRRLLIDFDVSGTFSLETNSVTLTKQVCIVLNPCFEKYLIIFPAQR